RRQITHRACGARITRKAESLAAASAKILIAPRARFARLLHPVGAAKSQKSRRAMPDVGQRMLAHIPELKTRDDFGSVTRKHAPGRSNIEGAAAPAADAGFGKTCEIIRHHRIDDDLAVVPGPQHLDLTDGLLDLLA